MVRKFYILDKNLLNGEAGFMPNFKLHNSFATFFFSLLFFLEFSFPTPTWPKT